MTGSTWTTLEWLSLNNSSEQRHRGQASFWRMPKRRAGRWSKVKPRKPEPHFEVCEWYEQVNRIRLEYPRRYFLFSPVTKRCLFIYLMMKQRADEMKRAA